MHQKSDTIWFPFWFLYFCSKSQTAYIPRENCTSDKKSPATSWTLYAELSNVASKRPPSFKATSIDPVNSGPLALTSYGPIVYNTIYLITCLIGMSVINIVVKNLLLNDFKLQHSPKLQLKVLNRILKWWELMWVLYVI